MVSDGMLDPGRSEHPEWVLAGGQPYKTMPSEKMSEAVPTGSPRACSGDMYITVPTRVPGSVPAAPPAALSAGSRRARPKSRTLTMPSGEPSGSGV